MDGEDDKPRRGARRRRENIFFDVSIRCDPNRLDDFCTASERESKSINRMGIEECLRSLRTHPVLTGERDFAYTTASSSLRMELRLGMGKKKHQHVRLFFSPIIFSMRLSNVHRITDVG